jgi:hypothetical protein
MASTFLKSDGWYNHYEDELIQNWMIEKQEKKMADLHRWKHLQQELKKIKAEEADLRRELCAEIIGGTQMVNGRVTVKTHLDHYEVKAVQTLSYSIDQAALSAIWDELTPEEKACIKMKPELALGDYKKLPEDSLLHEAVVSRLAMPTLTAELEVE